MCRQYLSLFVPVPVVVKVKVYFSKCIFLSGHIFSLHWSNVLKVKKSPRLFFSVKIKRCVSDQWVSEWSVISDKVTYWAVCGQLKKGLFGNFLQSVASLTENFPFCFEHFLEMIIQIQDIFNILDVDLWYAVLPTPLMSFLAVHRQLNRWPCHWSLADHWESETPFDFWH